MSEIKPLTLDEAKKIAEDYAQKKHLVLGKYEPLAESPFFGKESYSFSADDPKDKGQYVGLPLYITVDKILKDAVVERFM